MTGSSLWLLPPQDSKLNAALQHLIASAIPSIFPRAAAPHFIPHVTLTADTDLSADAARDPQAWLERLQLPVEAEHARLVLRGPRVGEQYFQKLTLACDKTSPLKDLAAACRVSASPNGGDARAAARDWVEGTYNPHLSLMYSEISTDDLEGKTSDVHAAITAARAEQEVRDAMGAEIVLVPTFKHVDEWQPVASRQLPNVKWQWEG